MKTKSIVLTLATLFVAVLVCLAAGDVNLGIWKLNVAKSKIPAGSGKNEKVVYAVMGAGIMVTVDGVDGKGKPAHNEWMGQFDGKDYAVKGDPDTDMRSYTRVDDHTLSLTNKKGGKVTLTGTVVVSADGKIRTVTTTSTDATGKKTISTAVYDKQ